MSLNYCTGDHFSSWDHLLKDDTWSYEDGGGETEGLEISAGKDQQREVQRETQTPEIPIGPKGGSIFSHWLIQIMKSFISYRTDNIIVRFFPWPVCKFPIDISHSVLEGGDYRVLACQEFGILVLDNRLLLKVQFWFSEKKKRFFFNSTVTCNA